MKIGTQIKMPFEKNKNMHYARFDNICIATISLHKTGFPTSILLHHHCHFVNAMERKFWITLQLKELTNTGISCAVLSEQKQLIDFSSVPDLLYNLEYEIFNI